MAIHDELTSPVAIHPAAFVGNTDPALDPDNNVQANKMWVDTTAGLHTLKIRNSTNTAWITMSGGSSSAAVVGPRGFEGEEGEEGPPGPPGASTAAASSGSGVSGKIYLNENFT